MTLAGTGKYTRYGYGSNIDGSFEKFRRFKPLI